MSLYLGDIPIANDGSHNTANVDLSNLSNTGEAHFADPALTNSPYTTNRILEIPQNIKLELNNGTVTLKAGSKVYVPNGFEQDGVTPKFDVVLISEDITHNASALDINDYAFNVIIDRSTLTPIRMGAIILGDSSSGTTPPSGTGSFYNTATNTIKFYSSGTPASDCSFPICKMTTSSTSQGTGYVKSIDQVFNGFGYIGSTVFALPGIKIQIPNGRNNDGTYNYLLKETTSVIRTSVSGSGFNQYIMIDSNGNIAGPTDKVKYDSELNSYIYTHDNSKQSWCIFAELEFESGKITSWKPYTVDSVANSNASNFSQAGRSYLSGLGMPDITKGYFISNTFATNTSFIAPCNGYFFFRAGWKAAGGIIVFLASVYGSTVSRPYAGGGFYYSAVGTSQQAWLPVKKGNKVQAQYNSNTDIAFDTHSGLWFIPAEGEN